MKDKVRDYIVRCPDCDATVRMDTDGDGHLVMVELDTWKRHPHKVKVTYKGEVVG